MIWELLIALTFLFAFAALVLTVLVPLVRDGSKPAPERAPRPAQPKPAQKHTPKHAATERIHAGGRYTARMPRRDAPPLTEQAIIRQREGRPWHTAPLPRSTAAYPHCKHCTGGTCSGPHQIPCADGCDDPAPVNDDAETLALGGWGVIPEGRNIAAEQRAEAYLT